jgi:hypothetical protein
VIDVLARAVAACDSNSSGNNNAPNQACPEIEKDRHKILEIMHNEALNDPSVIVGAVVALGICGEKQDITFLANLHAQDKSDVSNM